VLPSRPAPLADPPGRARPPALPCSAVTPVQRLAHYIARQPWLPTVGPRLVTMDLALQRLTGGRLSFVRLGGMTGVLLTTTGRHTGQPRSTPLIAIPDGDDLLLVASNWGKPRHPAWSANLIANPQATARVNTRTFPITAKLLTGEERAKAWTIATRIWPIYHDYEARSGREIRIFRATHR
jgi:deazaflavin-dependent oxidoreductase (nitroreductase family)